jgi:hypothetical protein
MARCPACDKEVCQSEQYKGWCRECVGKVQELAVALTARKEG